MFLHKSAKDDHFLEYMRRDLLSEFPLMFTLICLLPKEPADIDLSWRAIEYLKNSMGCIYVTDTSVQYDFKNSDAFAHARTPIEKTIIQPQYILFGPNAFNTLSLMAAIGAFCLIPAAPFIFIWIARWCTKGL